MAFTPLNALNAFLAVARRRSFAAAARDLGVSTSALSQSVRQLEERYPNVEVDVRVDNRFVNIVAEGFDAGIRLVEAIDRDMVHVRLSGPARLVVAAAPSYLERRGVPRKPTDLLQHDCICSRLSQSGELWAWELERGKKTWRVPVRGPVATNDAELPRALALAGVGLFYALEPLIADELARGGLRIVLEPYAPTVPGLFLYFPSRAQISPASRALVEVALEAAKTSDATT